MITGDKKETAVSVAAEIGLIPKMMSNAEEAESVLTSTQLRQIVDDQLITMIPRLRVIAR